MQETRVKLTAFRSMKRAGLRRFHPPAGGGVEWLTSWSYLECKMESDGEIHFSVNEYPRIHLFEIT